VKNCVNAQKQCHFREYQYGNRNKILFLPS